MHFCDEVRTLKFAEDKLELHIDIFNGVELVENKVYALRNVKYSSANDKDGPFTMTLDAVKNPPKLLEKKMQVLEDRTIITAAFAGTGTKDMDRDAELTTLAVIKQIMMYGEPTEPDTKKAYFLYVLGLGCSNMETAKPWVRTRVRRAVRCLHGGAPEGGSV